MNEILHIVCLDAPSPPDYGGAIDMYYKIIALSRSGKKIILHYFGYRSYRNASGLEAYCLEINVYDRKRKLQSFSVTQPFIVASRINQALIERLNQDNHDILLEGVHCTGIIPYLSKNRTVIVRMHNDEAEYYKRLFYTEKNPIRRAYYILESRLLKSYQKRLPHYVKYACISHEDINKLAATCGLSNLFYIPGFLPWQNITSKTGSGDYCLYHGNMAVAENEAAALWLIKKVFSQINKPFYIAGKNISKKLYRVARSFKHIKLITNPTNDEMTKLIEGAHVHVLPSFNHTGVKFKLLHALFTGRFCITNNQAIEGLNLHKGVIIANNAIEMINHVQSIFETPFSKEDVATREILLQEYNNQINAQKLIELLKHYQ